MFTKMIQGPLTGSWRENLSDAWAELGHNGSGWLEVFFVTLAVSAGGWAYWKPYVGEWFGLPPSVIGPVFALVGFIQLWAFLGRSYEARQTAGVFALAFWAGTTWTMFQNGVVGWLAAVAPLATIFQGVVFCILRNQSKRTGRRLTDKAERECA